MSTKLTIKTYSNEEFTAEKGEYVVTINPQNLRITNNIDYNSSRMPYNNNWNFKYNCTLPRQLSFSLLFDNTGIFPNTKINVKKQIDDLEGLIYNCKEDIKQPHFIRVIWGNIDFQGRLLKMQTEYGMFKNNGDIIRAQTDIVIIEQKPINSAGASQKGIEEKDEEKSASTNNTTKKENNDTNKKAENKIKEEKEEQSNEEVQNKAAKEKEDVKKENEDVESKDNQEEVEKENDTISEEEEEIDGNSEEEQQSELKEEEESELKEEEESDLKEEEGSETEDKNTEEEEDDKINDEEIEEENEETMVKSGDTLPSATKECLISSGIYPSSAMLNNLLSKAASFNLLNSLKDLVLGSVFLLPKKIVKLLKALFKKLINLLKRGATYIKTGAKKGINKISSVGKKIISKRRN